MCSPSFPLGGWLADGGDECSAAYSAAALALRDRLIVQWNKTQQRQSFADQKRVYYLSLEFLMGRALDNAMLNVGVKTIARGMVCFRGSDGRC